MNETKTMTDTIIADLLPCPFCGDADQLPVYDDYKKLWVIDCGACPASVFGSIVGTAIAAWNTRPQAAEPLRKQVACPAGCDDGVDWSSGNAEVCKECEGSGTFYVREQPEADVSQIQHAIREAFHKHGLNGVEVAKAAIAAMKPIYAGDKGTGRPRDGSIPSSPAPESNVERIASDYCTRFGMRHKAGEGYWLVHEDDLKKGISCAIREAMQSAGVGEK